MMDVQILCNITITSVKKPNYYSIIEETIYCLLKCYCIIYKHVKNTKKPQWYFLCNGSR